MTAPASVRPTVHKVVLPRAARNAMILVHRAVRRPPAVVPHVTTPVRVAVTRLARPTVPTTALAVARTVVAVAVLLVAAADAQDNVRQHAQSHVLRIVSRNVYIHQRPVAVRVRIAVHRHVPTIV